MKIPDHVAELADDLIDSAGVQAVVIGGSRAIGRHRPDRDWDIGVYYRNTIDLAALAEHGEVHPPGSWGRLMNGGSWLEIDGARVDVLLRDLSTVEHWTNAAHHGQFDIDGLLGYVAGIPTYSLTAEAHAAIVIRGHLAVTTEFPPALRDRAPGRWRFCRDFSLHHAEMHAKRANTVAMLGQTCRAILEEAHARCCETGRWVLNEKHLLDAAGLADINNTLVHRTADKPEPTLIVAEVRARLLETASTSRTAPLRPGPKAVRDSPDQARTVV